MKPSFYNDNEPYVVEWLKNLALIGEITDGDVNGEDIRRIESWQLAGYKRCHFFAGIGGWDYALQLAGWPADREVWTGSCPCQPFSVAGKRKGTDDERHLWPEFYRLIGECKPATIFGEQVASADGRKWLAGVFADLEALGYAVAGADLCAAGIGAPHIRQRLYWMADSERDTGNQRRSSDEHRESNGTTEAGQCLELGRHSVLSRLGNANTPGWQQQQERDGEPQHDGASCGADFDGSGSRLEHTESEQERLSRQPRQPRRSDSRLADEQQQRLEGRPEQSAQQKQPTAERNCSTFWSDYELIPCADGKARRIEPGTFPLAHGIPARVGKLRAYGNAIVPQVAATFIRAFMEAE